MSRDLEAALRGLAELFADLEVPWQVVGGLAVRSLGGQRPLADIDIYVPDADLARVAEALGPDLTRAPERHRDGHWDLTFLAALRHGWRVEVAGADSTRYRDAGSGRWHPAHVDFEASVHRPVEGVSLPVMPRNRLVAYKRALDREVDRVDVRELDGRGPGA